MVFGNISSALYLEHWVIMKLFFHKIVLYSIKAFVKNGMYMLLNWSPNAPQYDMYMFVKCMVFKYKHAMYE